MSSSNSQEIQIAADAVVSLECKLQGNITVGSMTVIYPEASLIAEAGPMTIGAHNIIEEQALIIHTSGEEIKNPVPLLIGVNNLFKVGSQISAKSIGDHNVFEPKCFVGPNVEIGNGCLIGAGCRITIAEKLPDFTVIIGRDSVWSETFDRPLDSDDSSRQADELTAMKEIFTREEFSSFPTYDELHIVFKAELYLPDTFFLALSKNTTHAKFSIRHLPPICLEVFLPWDYPSHSSPGFMLSSCWLTKTQLNRLADELTNLWKENRCEILFIWCSFLKDQSLELLKVLNSCDLSEKRVIDQHDSRDLKNEENLVEKGLQRLKLFHKDAVTDLYFYLIEYNVSKSKEVFKKTVQSCNVCFCNVLGELCMQLPCHHVTCIECLRIMCEVHINQGTMESIMCSESDCDAKLEPNVIRDLVSQELFQKYDRLMLNRTLDEISNKIYCPRIHCQYPVLAQGEDSLAVCPSCDYAFCIYCKRAYHGIEGCNLKSAEKLELIKIYQNCSYEKKLELEKKYGKKQLTELVTAAKSELWISENSKKCPCCSVQIEKNDGCNKMICKKCKANFCWICLTRVPSINPYRHFQNPDSACFDKLFDGFDDDFLWNAEDFPDDFVGMENEPL